MRFTEIDVFGVYVAPMSLMMVVAWLVTVALRAVAKQETVDEVADAMSPAPEDSCSYTLHIGCAAISQA